MSIHYQVAEPIDFEQRRRDMKTLMQLCYNVSEFMCKTWRLDTKVFISREGVSFVDDLIPFTNWKLEEPQSSSDSKDGEFDEEFLNKWRRVLKSTCPPEFLQELQRQAPYLKFDEPDTPNPARPQP